MRRLTPLAHLISIWPPPQNTPPIRNERDLTSDRANAPLKISFLIHRPSMSGGARVIARYARMLTQHGHEVFLTGLGAPAPSMTGRLRGLFSGAPKWKAPPSHYLLEGLDLKLVHGRNDLRAGDLPDADVVISTFWRTAEWMERLPPEKGARAYFVQGHEAAMPHTDKERAARTYLIDATLIAVSGWLVDILRETYGRDDVVHVANAVDVAAFAPQSARSINRTPRVGFVGSRNKVKRIDLAIDACKILKSRFPDLGVSMFAAHAPDSSLGLPDWIDASVNPSQPEIAAIYGGCDAWLFTSDEEGYGLPMLEAFAAGTPVVARPAGAAPDLVTAENGALVDSDDPAPIAEAAARILSLAPDEWKKMSDAAIGTARARDWNESFRKFEAVLYDVARKGP